MIKTDFEVKDWQKGDKQEKRMGLHVIGLLSVGLRCSRPRSLSSTTLICFLGLLLKHIYMMGMYCIRGMKLVMLR